MAMLQQPAEYPQVMGPAKHKNPKSHSHPATSDPKMNLPDENGWTPLMKACNRESLDNVRRLIAAGADVHKGDVDGFGPMMCACVEGRAEVVRFLLTHSAAVDRADEQGRTPLSWTVTKGDFHETADALISAGADVNRPDKDGFTPLMRAALLSHVRCFELLIRKGANVAPVSAYWGKTALEMAIERGSHEMRKLAESVRRGQNRR
jgi:ankyrin repeat protein